jgi:MFS family permease
LVEQFGLKNLGTMMGINAFLTAIPMAIGPLIAGITHDQTGSYRNAFFGFSILFIFSIILVWVSKFGKAPKSLDI